MAPRKSDFSALRKIAFSVRLGKTIFPLSEKSLFQTATEEKFFRSPKNRLFRPWKSELSALRKIEFQSAAEERLFRSKKNRCFWLPRKSVFYTLRRDFCASRKHTPSGRRE